MTNPSRAIVAPTPARRVTAYGPGFAWNCGYSFARPTRIAAFRAVRAAILAIPNPSDRPSAEELDGAYAQLSALARHAPRGQHGNLLCFVSGDRTWNISFDRVTAP